jgi:hypothetical protein
MPVEDVELVHREQVDVPQHHRLRHEMAGDVEMAPTPPEARRVLDLDAGKRPRHARDRGPGEALDGEELAKCLDAVRDPHRSARAQRDAVGPGGEPVRLVTGRPDAVDQREGDARTASRRDDRQRQPRGRPQHVAKPFGHRSERVGRLDLRVLIEGDRSALEIDLRGDRDEGRTRCAHPRHRTDEAAGALRPR